MACPICRSHQFYLKDPSDEYETYELEMRDGQIRFVETEIPDGQTEIDAESEIFCQTCAWHGKRAALQ